jgi:hypothetical protein
LNVLRSGAMRGEKTHICLAASLARMRLGRALLAALAVAVAPAQAAAATGDVTATHAYLQASYRLARASLSSVGAAQAKIERLNGKLARECPHAGAGSPQNDASQPVSGLVVVAEWSIAFGTNATPINTFLQTTKRLQWSNRTTTRIARRYATSLHEMAALPMPDLCQVIATWRASGFQLVPATVIGLVRHAEGIELNKVPPRMLAPFARGADASLLARTQSLQAKVAEAEFVNGVHDTFQLLDTLALNE